MQAVNFPYLAYPDTNGLPLTSGKLWIGAANTNPETSPLTVYWDAAGTLPAAQPIQTLNGFLYRAGKPAKVYVSGKYSMTLRNKAGEQVVYEPELGDPDPSDNEVSVVTAGAIGDGEVDDTLAFQVAYSSAIAIAEALGGAKIKVPGGRKYRITEELDWWQENSPRLDIEVRGEGQLSSQIVCDFYGADKALIKVRDPLGVSRASPISFYDIGFEHAGTTGGINPVFIDILGWGESRMFGVRFGPCNNSHVRLISAQNCRLFDVVSFYGGRWFNYKATNGVTFDVNSGTSTITASLPIFDSTDINGKSMSIFPSDASRRIHYSGLTRVDDTHATYSDATGLTETGAAGHFEPARGNIAALDNVFTANANVFTNDMRGLVLFIRGAVAGAYGDGMLRAKITNVLSASSVELDTDATADAIGEFFGVAAIDMGTEAGFAGSSDVMFELFHCEHYRGIGFAGMNTDAYQFIGAKFHGETTVTDTEASVAAMWLDDFGGYFKGILDSSCSMADARIYLCNLNDTVELDFHTRGIIHGKVIKTELLTDVGGQVYVPFLSSAISFPDPYDMVDDANFNADPTDRRVQLCYVNMLSDSQTPRRYAGGSAYFDPSGRYYPAKYADDAIIGSTIAWDGTAPSGTIAQHYIWSQPADSVDLLMRIEATVAGVTNTKVTINLPADMPTPLALVGTGVSEVVCPGAGLLGTSALAMVPSKAWLQKDGSGNFQFVVELDNTGSPIAAKFATIRISYPAA